ncbi:Farnesyl diphosphate synthase [Botrimarina colliarenosi]|uniref:Farnesyl diphosphate synthase n=1 Tax=Botrimarina colliarenosi TaxID=2528001 RepID=A0A5C6AJE0_9BACT|nr:farnesyl diphosphate synthase [Botrimarina colliarenosi]TWT99759.1 Farnesyl diphosphate synthase [Botrimarina colliarenosi]
MLTEAATKDPSEAAADVQAIEGALSQALSDAPGRPPRLLEAMRYAVLGPGKRLRPRLVLTACRACGGDPADALPAACAVEMIHAYSLVHDDLPAMDDDDLRRGRPTVHRQFDEATAILVGDALLALAFETLVWPPTPVQVAAPACRELAHAAGPAMLVGGQADDLSGAEAAPDDRDAALAHLEAIHRRKTGAMINVSLRLGALCASAKPQQLSDLTAYGDALGLLFQVTDDLLDVAGDESAVGKRVGKDQQAGKLTYPVLLGVEASRAYAAEMADRAVAALASFGPPAEPLRRLTRQILERDR